MTMDVGMRADYFEGVWFGRSEYDTDNAGRLYRPWAKCTKTLISNESGDHQSSDIHDRY